MNRGLSKWQLAMLIPLLWPCLTGTTVLSAETPWNLNQLMRDLANLGLRNARFIEIREITLLQQALRSEGTLMFRPPDTLIKQFDAPSGLHYEIEANRLLIRKPNGKEEIVRLDNAPQLLAYVAALRAVLGGDLEQLQTYFRLSLSGNRDAWLLKLKPKTPALARQVAQIEITGSRNGITRFVVSEQNGDSITTRLRTIHGQ